MMWVDYNINQAGDNFRIEGDWYGEVMGLDRQGNPGNKTHPVYFEMCSSQIMTGISRMKPFFIKSDKRNAKVD